VDDQEYGLFRPCSLYQRCRGKVPMWQMPKYEVFGQRHDCPGLVSEWFFPTLEAVDFSRCESATQVTNKEEEDYSMVLIG
jgi:hypothetical protein